MPWRREKIRLVGILIFSGRWHVQRPRSTDFTIPSILLVFLPNLTLSSSFEQFCIESALVNFFSKSNIIRALQFNLFLSLTNIKKKEINNFRGYWILKKKRSMIILLSSVGKRDINFFF